MIDIAAIFRKSCDDFAAPAPAASAASNGNAARAEIEQRIESAKPGFLGQLSDLQAVAPRFRFEALDHPVDHRLVITTNIPRTGDIRHTNEVPHLNPNYLQIVMTENPFDGFERGEVYVGFIHKERAGCHSMMADYRSTAHFFQCLSTMLLRRGVADVPERSGP